MVKLEFLNNANGANQVHEKFTDIIKTNKITEIKIASAFFEFNKQIKKIFDDCINKKISITIIVGNKPYNLTKKSAHDLDEFVTSNKKHITLYSFKESKKNPTFHSKFYLFKGNSIAPKQLIFGSSNMTNAGFSTTYESNIYTNQLTIFSDLENEFSNIPTKKFDKKIYNQTKQNYPSIPELGTNSDLLAPYDYQDKIIKKILTEFKKNDKGHVILPCGTGKTMISLWVNEKMENNKVLVFLPTIALLKQTLENWHNQRTEDYETMCVCSDTTVGLSNDETKFKKKDLEGKYVNKKNITTDQTKIRNFIFNNKKFVIFSTYHSSSEIINATKHLKKFKFDCVFYDETHNIATVKSKNAQAGLTASHNVQAHKKLFMTATPKIINQNLLPSLSQSQFDIYSMDNPAIFGPEFYNMTFKEAIDNPEIPVLPIKLLLSYASKSSNKSSNKLANKQTALLKVLGENEQKNKRFDVNKIISYHRDIKNAKSFIGGNFETIWLNNLKTKPPFFKHINGTNPAKTRKIILDGLDKSSKGIISNCRCLSEGIDTPSIDAVFFSDPKTNVIDIVQATGRAMRKDLKNDKKEYAYVVVPIDDDAELKNIVYVIQALATTYKDAKQLIDNIVTSHQNNKSSKIPDWIDTIPKLPKKELEKLWKSLKTQISYANIPLNTSGKPKTNYFWKRLSHNDVRGKSSPGQISIDKNGIEFFPLCINKNTKSDGTEYGKDVFFDITFVDADGKEETVKQVRHQLLSNPKHKRWTKEDHRFTFRNKKFMQRKKMKEGDILKFEKINDQKFPMRVTLIKKNSSEAKKSPYRDYKKARTGVI